MLITHSLLQLNCVVTVSQDDGSVNMYSTNQCHEETHDVQEGERTSDTHPSSTSASSHISKNEGTPTGSWKELLIRG